MAEHLTENESKVEAAAEAMRSSRLAWGLHSDLMRDTERSRAFWTEAATVALAAVGVIPPDQSCTCGAVEHGAAQHLAPCPLRPLPSGKTGA